MIIAIPEGFPWENGNPHFPLPMQTSNFQEPDGEMPKTPSENEIIVCISWPGNSQRDIVLPVLCLLVCLL